MENKALDLSFDQYTRNKIIADILAMIAGKRSGGFGKVLDVGGRNGKLDLFLAESEYHVLDRMEKGDDSGFYYRGDARNLPFKSRLFDTVISTDMYEHLTPGDRCRALKEMLRVSKNYVILTCPFYSPEVEKAEKDDNDYFLRVTGREHPWLREHIGNTLPRVDELEGFLNDMGLGFVKVGSNNISNWLLMQLLIAYAHNYEVPPENMMQTHRYYNEHFSEVGDLLEPTYRQIYVIGRKGTLPKININDMYKAADPIEREELTVRVFNALLTGAKNRENYEKQQEALLTHKEAYTKHLEGVIRLKDQTLKEKDHRISLLEQEIADTHQSISWKAVSKFQTGIVERFLPAGTGRREAYDHLLRGGRVIVNEGLGNFLTKYRNDKNSAKKGNEFRPLDPAYERWISENEPTEAEIEEQKLDSARLRHRPLISIITPVYNTPPAVLDAMILSVIGQTYDRWELCLADGNSKDEAVRDILKKYAQEDARIKVKFLPENLGISGNTNEALEIAAGEYFALLDHDDTLAPFALYEVAQLINKEPALDFIYSDKDMVTEDGKTRFQPFFKPDWSPEIMLSANYLTHLCVIRASLLEKIGGFLKETDGAQDWDMFLRVVDCTDKIGHIPKVLYHWRMIDTSCAKSGSKAKPYIFDAQKKSLENHLLRLGLSAELIFNPPGIWEVRWIPATKRKASLIIVSRDNGRLTRCIGSIIDKTTYKDFELVIVRSCRGNDNTNEGFDGLPDDPRIRSVDYTGAYNYAAMVNLGVKSATGDVIVLLNERLEVATPGWIEGLVGWLEQDGVGAVGAKVVDPDGMIRETGIVLGVKGFAGSPFRNVPENSMTPYGYTEWYRDFSAFTGDCMAIRKELVDGLGGFNEKLPGYNSDIDFCLRARQDGYRIVYTPFVKLMARHKTNTVNAGMGEELEALWISYRKANTCDQYYNVNLSRRDMTPGIKTLEETVENEA